MKKRQQSLWPLHKSAAAATLLILSPAVSPSMPQTTAEAPAIHASQQEKMPQGKFFCNPRALTPAERAHHKKLTEKLLAMRNETIPTEKGYELQFDPYIVSLAQLTDWVSAESRCCPFFDFHIDLEHAGRLLCLRITGEDGVKSFIESEFNLKAK